MSTCLLTAVILLSIIVKTVDQSSSNKIKSCELFKILILTTDLLVVGRHLSYLKVSSVEYGKCEGNAWWAEVVHK